MKKGRSPASRPPERENSLEVRQVRARQQRSALTETKLLEAAVHLLETEGPDAATVPRIAAEAGLSAAALYRRFTDKDDLLRSALLHALHQSGEADTVRLQGKRPRATLAGACEQLIAALHRRYRKHPLLLRALARRVEAAPGSAFAQEATRRVAADLCAATTVLLAHRDEIRHPDPERAVRFALLSAASTLEGLTAEQVSLWHTALPLTEEALLAELTRQMLAYLRRKP